MTTFQSLNSSSSTHLSEFGSAAADRATTVVRASSSWSRWATAIAGLAVVMTGFSQPVQAAQLTTGWNYSIDAMYDGSGGDGYDIHGIAMSVQSGRVLVALTGGMPITGTEAPSAEDGNIGWGDLIFNFTGRNLSDRSVQGNLFGVRFASTNDTFMPVGVYSNVITHSAIAENNGYSSLNRYYNAGFERPNTMGDALPTRAAASQYFGADELPQTSITYGTRLGDISWLYGSELAAQGLNFGANAGTHTFGFSFDANLLPAGSFLAHVFTECANDGVAIEATSAEAVPEPTTMAGLALAGAGLTYARRRKAQGSKLQN